MKPETSKLLDAQRNQSTKDLAKLLDHMKNQQLNANILESALIVYEHCNGIFAWTSLTIKNSKALINFSELNNFVNEFVNFDYLEFAYYRDGSTIRINYKTDRTHYKKVSVSESA